MRVKVKYLLMVTAMTLAMPSFAYYKERDKSDDGKGSNQNGFNGKANCAPATATLNMEFNNVRAVLNTNGVLFRDFRNNGKAGYEVPKVDIGIKRTAIYAAALWMGEQT